MYTLHNVTKQFRTGSKTVTALKDVDLTIEDRDLLAIQGPTGHGKSTLLQMLGGLDRPTSGTVEFDGKHLHALGERTLTDLRAKSFGFIFQSFNLIPTLTARENVEVALVPLGVSAKERRQRAGEMLSELGLADRLEHLPSELSGGQQQRVAIARALVKKPQVLLADEPTGNLDEDTRDEIIDLLEKLWHTHDLTLIMVTHDSTVARRAQRVATIKKGRISVRTNDRASQLSARNLADQMPASVERGEPATTVAGKNHPL